MFSKILKTEILQDVKQGFYGFTQKAFYGKKSFVFCTVFFNIISKGISFFESFCDFLSL